MDAIKQPSRSPFRIVIPSWRDPRVMMSVALTLWTVLGQTTFYFNRDLFQLGLAVGVACLLDMVLAGVVMRQLILPLSAYQTALSIGLLLESYDWRLFVIAPAWGVLSKYLIRNSKQHFFNPSNFALVMALLLTHGRATIAPGSQWGADYRVSVVIAVIGMVMMIRVNRVGLVFSWVGGYVFMSILRMAGGQGGAVFTLGPMTGAEFALFTFSMLPDPKASPPTARGRLWWGFSIAVLDGVMRYYEMRYSMFYSLFIHTAILPIMRWVAEKAGLQEADPWKLVTLSIFGKRPVSSNS